MSSIAAALGEFALSANPRASREVVDAAKTAIFDGVACMVGGTREEFGAVLHSYADDLGGESGQSTILGSGLRASPASAAYINAAAGHSLCYDDTSNTMMGHPTIVVLPACLAVGEWVGASGEELLEAYAVGVEVAVRTSEVLAPHHYKKGWHATGIAGGVGAAAACSRLLQLSVDRCAAAINIAATSAQGLRANFGSMAMIYHAGLAARGGVDASILASKGMTSALDAFSGTLGYFAMYAGNEGSPPNFDKLSDRLGNPYELVLPGLDVKPYPCGSLGHRCIQGVIELRNEYGLDPAAIRSITCHLPELHQQVLVNDRPRDILESRISLVYPVSVAALNGSCGVSDFSYDLLSNPTVKDLMSKVVVRGRRTDAETGAELFAAPAEVTLELSDGSVLTREVSVVKGSPGFPLNEDEWQGKFDDCVSPTLGPEQAATLAERVRSLEGISNVSELTKLMTRQEV